MDQIETLRIFCAVVQAGSFTRAADATGLKVPVVSRAINALERRLGVRLFHRTTRHLALTEAAEQYYDGCKRVLAQLDELEDGIASLTHEPTGVLRIVAHSNATANCLPMLTTGFKRRYPAITLDVTLAERPIDLVAEGYDIGLVLPFMLSAETVVTRTVDRIQLVLVASTDYIDSHPAICHPGELCGHSFVAFASAARRTSLSFSGVDGNFDVPVNYGIASNSVVYNLDMVLAGFGLAVLPMAMVDSYIRAGRLVRLLENYSLLVSDAELRLAYSSRAFLPAKVRAFIEHTVDFFAGIGEPEEADLVRSMTDRVAPARQRMSLLSL